MWCCHVGGIGPLLTKKCSVKSNLPMKLYYHCQGSGEYQFFSGDNKVGIIVCDNISCKITIEGLGNGDGKWSSKKTNSRDVFYFNLGEKKFSLRRLQKRDFYGHIYFDIVDSKEMALSNIRIFPLVILFWGGKVYGQFANEKESIITLISFFILYERYLRNGAFF